MSDFKRACTMGSVASASIRILREELWGTILELPGRFYEDSGFDTDAITERH